MSTRKENRPANVAPLRKPRACPACGKPSQRAFYPFCCQRCADIDLNRWLSNNYTIASQVFSPESPESSDG
jgi:uncharacterized protein